MLDAFSEEGNMVGGSRKEEQIKYLPKLIAGRIMYLQDLIEECSLVQIGEKITTPNSDHAKYEMYQCPYEKSCRCRMDEPCKGCETWAAHFA